MTTRSMDVALTIGSVAYHNSELLLEDDIWSVFVKHVLKDGDAGENLGLVRMKVVQKCCGLPLAARGLSVAFNALNQETNGKRYWIENYGTYQMKVTFSQFYD